MGRPATADHTSLLCAVSIVLLLITGLHFVDGQSRMDSDRHEMCMEEFACSEVPSPNAAAAGNRERIGTIMNVDKQKMSEEQVQSLDELRSIPCGKSLKIEAGRGFALRNTLISDCLGAGKGSFETNGLSVRGGTTVPQEASVRDSFPAREGTCALNTFAGQGNLLKQEASLFGDGMIQVMEGGGLVISGILKVSGLMFVQGHLSVSEQDSASDNFIRVLSAGDAFFVNCTFVGLNSRHSVVSVEGGTAKFHNCSFSGLQTGKAVVTMMKGAADFVDCTFDGRKMSSAEEKMKMPYHSSVERSLWNGASQQVAGQIPVAVRNTSRQADVDSHPGMDQRARAVRILGGRASFSYCSFFRFAGGGAEILPGSRSQDVHVKFQGCVFAENGGSAVPCGGAVNVIGGSRNHAVEVVLEACQVRGNRAVDGGGVCVHQGGVVRFGNGSRVDGNHALERGGGLFVDGSAFLDGFSQDVSPSHGGIDYENGVAFFDGGEIVYNFAGGHGGGVWAKGKAVFRNVHVRENMAKGEGGGVWASGGGVKLRGGLIEGNSADFGGGNLRSAGREGGLNLDAGVSVVKGGCALRERSVENQKGEEEKGTHAGGVGNAEMKIFVSIVSYRDVECAHTILDAILCAEFPDRISFGVVQQHDDAWEGSCASLTALREPRFLGKINTDVVSPKDARGPVWARVRAQKLLRDEQFVLQIDSHTRFSCGWDTTLVKLHTNLRDTRAIITTYPPPYRPGELLAYDAPPARLAALHFDPRDHMLRIKGTEIDKAQCFSRSHPRASKEWSTSVEPKAVPVPAHVQSNNDSKPDFAHDQGVSAQGAAVIESLFWAAGFSFAASSIYEEVPYDPSLEGLFFGEEAIMSARLFTSGYNFYAPCVNVIFHRWERKYRNTFWQEKANRRSPVDALKRVREILVGAVVGEYALGSARTLEDFEEHANISFKTLEVGERARAGLTL